MATEAVLRLLENAHVSINIVFISVITVLVSILIRLAWRPAVPKTAPKLLNEGYPILGMLRFFSDRSNFLSHGMATTKSGNFSFYFGKHHIINVSGIDGRMAFFESKDLNMVEG